MRQWKLIGAIIALLGEAALQMSGFTSLPLAIALALICVGLLFWSAYPIVKRIRWQLPVKFQRQPESATNKQTVEKYTNNEEYSPEVIRRLDELISEGERLVGGMQVPDFPIYTTEKVGESVRRWLDNVECDVWKLMPERASYVVAPQGDFTFDERLRYQAWSNDNAALRISVDRRLSRLREVRSRMKVAQSSSEVRQDYDYYLTRTSLRLAKGTLKEQLAKFGANTVWASMNVGRLLRGDNFLTKPWKTPPLDKLVLLDPNGKFIGIYAEKVERRRTKDVKAEIELTASEALLAGVEVSYFDGPIADGLIIAFQATVTKRDIQGDNLSHDAWSRVNEKEAWAKVDLGIPFDDPENCPNCFVHNKGKEDAQVFEALVSHYIKMLNAKPTPDKGDPQT